MSGQAGVLVERKIMVEEDGVEGRREVVLQIGHPQWSKGGDDAVCAIAIRGLSDDMPPVHGRDFFDVLVRAARTLKLWCKAPPAGVRLFYLDGEPYEGEPFDSETLAAEEQRFLALSRDDWSVLVERRILVQEDGDDERREIVLQVGHPYWMIEGELAACPVAMKGLEDDVEHRSGRDPFEALSNAVRHINEYFSGTQCGRYFFWPDGEPYGGDFPDIRPARYEPDPREKSGNWDVLAERTLLVEQDGVDGRRKISVRIGHPYRVVEGEARCPFEVKGWFDDMPAVSGEDPYSALISAIEFFDRYLRPANPSVRYFWPDGTPYAGEPLDREPDAPSRA